MHRTLGWIAAVIAVFAPGASALESLRDQQDWHARQGTVPRKVNIDEIVDGRLVKHAVGQLGVMAEKRP